jgi:hypothetical protein
MPTPAFFHVLRIAAPVAGDLIAVGGTLRISAAAAQDLYAAGGPGELEGQVARNERVAGGSVTAPAGPIAVMRDPAISTVMRGRAGPPVVSMTVTSVSATNALRPIPSI